MFTVAKKDRDLLDALIKAALKAHESALMIRSTQGRSVLKTDVAVRELYDAAKAAQTVTFKPAERKRRESTRK